VPSQQVWQDGFRKVSAGDCCVKKEVNLQHALQPARTIATEQPKENANEAGLEIQSQ
jgi:hypothetical protein